MYLMFVTQAPTNTIYPEGCESVFGVPCVTNMGTTGIFVEKLCNAAHVARRSHAKRRK
jgi:hypothetical protein